MFASSIRPFRWSSEIILSIVTIFILRQVVLRLLHRVLPRPMPSRLTPVLTTPWRSRLFGTPEQVLDRAGVMPGMQVLEIGPGPGVYTVPLAHRVAAQGERGSITCVEIQPQMIEMLREHLQDARVHNVEVIQGDGGRQIPSPQSSFDLVFLVDVLGEISEKSVFLRECARVLKLGGTLAVTEQVTDPGFQLPGRVRSLAADAGLREEGMEGQSWWTYTTRYRK